MPDRPEPRVLEAYTAQTRRLTARRVPLGVRFSVAVVGIAGLIELVYFPHRIAALIASFGVEVALCVAAVIASRQPRFRPWSIPLTTAATFGVGACMILYAVRSGASGDALAFVLIIFLTGAALLYPWGGRGQVPLAVGTLAAYVGALAAGVRGDLPLPYGIFAVGGGAVTSILGAVFLDRHRRSIFHQRVLLERARDQQMTMLYEATRTVTATLELQQVLQLVCQSVLAALGVERLWLFWRSTAGADVCALEARRHDGRIDVTEFDGGPGCGESLLRAGAHPGPELRAPRTDELAVLRAVRSVPSHLLHLPLAFQSELVGVVLADMGHDDPARTPTFLDFAATLGNSAAMAIGNARLHTLVLQHRAELQRLSQYGLAVVEDVMRSISHELHDGTCQALTAIKMDLGVLERQLSSEANGLARIVRDIRTQVVAVMHGVREMSHLIRPPVLDDFGAVAAIESLAAKYRDGMALAVQVECADPTMRFEPAVELLLFRIFQEALMNVAKHASATRVDTRLALEDGGVRLEIVDDGRGFDANAYFRSPPTSAGLGLLGMRERVAHFGGSFRITSRPGGGTRIVVSVPAQPARVAEVAAAI